MSRPTPMHLTLHNAAPASRDLLRILQGALKAADPLQAMVLLPMIAKAAELDNDVRALLAAVQEQAK